MPEPRTLPLVVASVADVTPHMRRIQLSGSALDAFDYFPGQDLALGVVRDDGTIVRRRYTIRRFDAGRQLLDLEVVMHGDGPGIRWARAAHPGLISGCSARMPLSSTRGALVKSRSLAPVR